MHPFDIVRALVWLAAGLACPSHPSLVITKASGDEQHGTLSSPLAEPLVVRVTDGHGAPLPGIRVRWAASKGNGSLDVAASATDANGLARARWTLDGTFLANSANAYIAGSFVTFAALGNGSGDLGGRAVFPAANPWRTDISAVARDPNSAKLIASCGANAGLHPDFGTVYGGAPNGIPYVVVHGTQPKVPVRFYYGSESDPGPYPVPPYAPVQGGASSTGDRHVLVVDADSWKVYEMFDAHPVNGGKSWDGGSGAIFDLTTGATRPAGWTSADAAGMPIFPGLVRYDEVALRRLIGHALRFSCARTRKAYVAPARHSAGRSSSFDLPPMGMRVRLKSGYDISAFSAPNRVILTALKKYGMFLIDNGADMFLSGAPDPRWDDDDLHQLTAVRGEDFEVILMPTPVTRP